MTMTSLYYLKKKAKKNGGEMEAAHSTVIKSSCSLGISVCLCVGEEDATMPEAKWQPRKWAEDNYRKIATRVGIILIQIQRIVKAWK